MKFKLTKPGSLPGNKSPDNTSPGPVPTSSFSRRLFLHSVGIGIAGLGLQQVGCSGSKHAGKATSTFEAPKIAGFENAASSNADHAGWQAVSDRKIRVGLVGYGASRFSAAFGFQDHPNV